MKDSRKPRIVARWEPQERPAGEGETEARLLEGTLRCLRDYGLCGTSSRAIAAAAGVNLGAITYHFGSKDELVARVLLRAIREWLAPVLAILRQEIDPGVRMLAAVEALKTSFQQARDMLPVYLEALAQAPRTDSLRRGVEELFGELRSLLASQTHDLRTMGYLPAWVDPDAMATLFMATADGIALHATLDPSAVDPEMLSAQVVQLLLATGPGR